MDHKKHMLWMVAGMVVLIAVAWITNTSYILLTLSPLLCVGMMLLMMLAMGANHDKK